MKIVQALFISLILLSGTIAAQEIAAEKLQSRATVSLVVEIAPR
jgi:hypothetical protein